MADKGKKKFKLTLKYDILKYSKTDFSKDSVEFVKADKDLLKLVKPLEFKVDAELDERKWNPKKLEDEAWYGFRMAVKFFDEAVHKAKKTGNKDTLKRAYDDMVKDADYGFDKWMKDQESGKADNAKALKDGKAAFAKMDGVEFKGAFDGPRKTALEALNPLTKTDKPDPQEGAKVLKALEAAKGKLDDAGKDAEAAIGFLMRTAKNTKKDKDVDPDLQSFATDILKHESEFEAFLAEADYLNDTFNGAINALKKGAIDKDEAKRFCEGFMSSKPLDKYAQNCLKLAKKLKPQFKKIEKKLG